MHQIDKEKFGAFLVQLRKEKGITQKELAEQLYVSDKAVSKWERALSLPDIALLQPLSEALGVSTTELLSGRYIREDQPLTVREVEPLVTGVLTLTAEELSEQKEHRRRWGKRFAVSTLACALGMWLLHGTGWLWDDLAALALMPPVMALIFGVYLIFLSKEKLPAFYDQYRLNFVSDGIFSMSFFGVAFNNRNWSHILNAMRTWACATLAGWFPLYCLIRWVASLFFPDSLPLYMALLFLGLFEMLGSMFIPVYVVGKKYE